MSIAGTKHRLFLDTRQSDAFLPLDISISCSKASITVLHERLNLVIMSLPILFIYILPVVMATYVLQDDYTPSNFLSMFNFFDGSDPTQGYGMSFRMTSLGKR